MDRISKLALLSIVILIAVIYIGIFNPLLSLILGSISLVSFMRNIFEIKKYHNRNLYLIFSVIILIVGIISTGIWVFNQDEILSRAIIGTASGLLIVSTFQTAFTSTRKWNEVRTH